MIRRNPTRIELKLDDLNEFEAIQKSDKKKTAAVPAITGPEAQKLIRQERVGLAAGITPVTAPLPPPTAGRPIHFRRPEPLPHAATPTGAGISAANGGGLVTPSLVVQTPASFDEFGIGIVADSSNSAPTSSPSSITPTNSGPEVFHMGSATPTPGNNVTTSSMELSLDYLNH